MSESINPVKIISQETFNDVVQENITEFSMTPAEAREETIKQFEAQGINLSNIIKDLKINEVTGRPVLTETIEDLKTHIGRKSMNISKLLEYLQIIDEECKKSLAHRILAGKNGAQDALITLLDHELAERAENQIHVEVLRSCLKALNSLTQNQPDLFGPEALALIFKVLELNDDKLTISALQWLQKACIMHEKNRQNILNSGILKQLKPLVAKETAPSIICEVLALFRFLVLDDDIRVEFGNAHEHARQIASEVILDLTKLLGEYSDTTVLSDLFLTIAALAVRNEFCSAIDDAGGLKLIFDIMLANKDIVRLNREALKLLRALAGHDGVKVHMVQQGAAPVIKEILDNNLSNENVVSVALACTATLTLRVKENSTAFFETGIVDIIVEAMRLYPKSKIVQRNGAWAVRNMVSRSRDQCEKWISLGVEDLLNAAMTAHPTVQQDLKMALRDLGCKVELKEEWTGTAEKKIGTSQI